MMSSLSISRSKGTYLALSLLAILAIALYGAQREVEYDLEVYFFFYRSLIEEGITSVVSCQSFEPLFCVGSFVFSEFTGSELATHFIWTCLFYLVTLRAFLLFWPLFVPDNRYSVISFIAFVFISINYVDPQAVYFLTRQYVASSLIMLGIARYANNKSPTFSFILAALIHFGALPIIVLVYLCTRSRLNVKTAIAAIVILLVAVYLSSNTLVQFYVSSVQYKLTEYQSKNDGDVTALQEIRVFVYLMTTAYIFKSIKTKLSLSFVLLYIFYLFTFQNELFHIRYLKYLEVMTWPSAFVLFYIVRNATGYVFISALFLRIYRYLSLLSPESAVLSLTKVAFLALLSWLK